MNHSTGPSEFFRLIDNEKIFSESWNRIKGRLGDYGYDAIYHDKKIACHKYIALRTYMDKLEELETQELKMKMDLI